MHNTSEPSFLPIYTKLLTVPMELNQISGYPLVVISSLSWVRHIKNKFFRSYSLIPILNSIQNTISHCL